jgi:4-amino-4-deoxy-L-arabinose transferase-like glycosyltransferase
MDSRLANAAAGGGGPVRAAFRAVPLGTWCAAGAQLVLHLATNGRYGIFRDELYYLACARHLDWGYVDQPPLSIALLAVVRALAGDSVAAIRVLPALAGAAAVVMAAWLVRELGGGTFARNLTALAVAVAPVYLVTAGFFSMNAFDLLSWLVLLLLLVRLLHGGDPRLWLAFGIVAGLGMLNKWSVAFLALGLAAALPLVPLRRHLRSRYLWLGAAAAGVIASPYLLWQVAHGCPTLEFMDNARRFKNAPFDLGDFLFQQVLLLHPLTVPLWGLGLAALLAGRRWRRERALGVLFVAVAALLLAYPVLLAAGAVVLEAALARRRRRWPRAAILAALGLGGIATAPLAVPLLPVEGFVRYQAALGLKPPSGERSALGELPQHFADRFGWPELTAVVAEAWHRLPEAERRRAIIVTGNYGEAGAIDYFGARYGLPPARSQHNTYYLWGPGHAEVETVLAVGIPAEDLAEAFDVVQLAARFEHPWAMPYETGDVVYVARGLRLPLDEAWRAGRHFI